ncbi:MAG: hypothetical protein PF503_05150 [Desulfobacula sp.]|jgi:hypothetical protein|nr:hypothetical protein [Desulfobacula sp.]
MNRILYISLAAIMGVTLFVVECQAFELKSRYATITYSDHGDLRRFNKELYMGRLKSMVKRQGADTIEEEVVAKINVIVEKTMVVLDMYPPSLNFSIVIHPNVKAVKKDFRRLYNVDVDYIAFYSPHKNRVFYSADNGRLRVVVHEIGHVVAENYFKISPPQRIHEVLAQYAEKHIND